MLTLFYFFLGGVAVVEKSKKQYISNDFTRSQAKDMLLIFMGYVCCLTRYVLLFFVKYQVILKITYVLYRYVFCQDMYSYVIISMVIYRCFYK